MPSTLDSYAVEQSTFAIVATFTDEADDALTPDSITWSLCNEAGKIINSLQDEAIVTPASAVTIVLSGNDLQILDENNNFEIRYLEISAVYDSDIGSDLPLKDSAQFKVLNLKSIET